jgi:RimJ/RimL family protein N-acetyltransferase
MGLPLPHLVEHAEKWICSVKDNSDSVLHELFKAEIDDPHGRPKIVEGCPVNILREVREDGSEVYLGDISIKRYNWVEVADQDQKSRLLEENTRRSVGDPDIIWGFGGRFIIVSSQFVVDIPSDYLASSHHGHGIMSTAVATILREWAIPRMNVRRMRVNTIEGNVSSVKVFEKNGFRMKETVSECLEATGKKLGLHVLEWTYPSSE